MAGSDPLGIIALMAFLDLNDRHPDLTEDELYDLVTDIAAGRERDVLVVASRLDVLPPTKESEGRTTTEWSVGGPAHAAGRRPRRAAESR